MPNPLKIIFTAPEKLPPPVAEMVRDQIGEWLRSKEPFALILPAGWTYEVLDGELADGATVTVETKTE